MSRSALTHPSSYGSAAAASPALAPLPPNHRRVILASSLGTVFEWYDFYLFAALAPLIARRFFGAADPSSAFILALLAFAAGFIVRPVGALLFGRLGDLIGRKYTFLVSIVVMGLSTFSIGLLPSHDAIGMAAPVFLVGLRLLQGLSLGGEYGGAATYVAEHAPRQRRGAYTAWIQTTATLGLLASLAVIVLTRTLLGEAAFEDWGWRVPFLVAAPLGLIGLYMRLHLDESPAFRALAAAPQAAHSPLKETLLEHGRTIFCLSAFISATALSFYTFTTYLTTYMQVVGGASRPTALLASLVALLFAALLCPLVGRYSDRVGRRRTIFTGCACLIVAVYPAFMLAGSGSLLAAALGAMLLAVGAVVCGVVTAVLLSEQFPTQVRYTASAFTYNLAYTVFGGTAPLVATWLIGQTGNPMSPAFYLIAIALLALAGGMALPESCKRSLDYQPE